MGSEGTGRFSDYSNNVSGSEGAANKGSSGEDPCNQVVITLLEDVERSPYYLTHNSPPEVNTSVVVVVNKRLGVEVDGEVIGFLPTEFNFLVACIKSGISYRGIITSVAISPFLRVQVRINRV